MKKEVLPGVLFHEAMYYISNVLLTVGTLREKFKHGLNISHIQICWEGKKTIHKVKNKTAWTTGRPANQNNDNRNK